MLNNIPIYNKSNLEFYREENRGNILLISKYHPELKEIILNGTTKEILELCDGEKTIEGVIEQMKSKYPSVSKDRITQDVKNILANMSRMMVVEWKEENPFLFLKEEMLDEEHFLRVGVEEDIDLIIDFIERNELFSNSVKEGTSYVCPYKGKREYIDIALRQKIFNYNEDFFFITKDEKIVGMISIQLPVNPSKAAVINLLKCPVKYLDKFLDYAFFTLPSISISEITKIKILEDESRIIDTEFKEILLKKGFKEEGLLVNELEFGSKVKTWAWHYDKEYIEKINKNRRII